MKSTTHHLSIRDNAKLPAIIYGFDRITVWLDHPELPIKIAHLKRHCTNVEESLQQMPFNPRWKLKVELYQPTIEGLELLESALGYEIAVCVTYVEIACDIRSTQKGQARKQLKDFLAGAYIPNLRQTAQRDYMTWYFGRRANENGIQPSVLVAYADKPSKLNNAQPAEKDLCDLHIEGRRAGTKGLKPQGIISLSDLIQFNHQKFWDNNLVMYQLPKLAQLGRLLAADQGRSADVSGTALRKRAHAWIERYSNEGAFVLHNALRDYPQLKRHLSKVKFSEWLKMIVQ
ncbi:MAG: hypothetical protein WC073_03855 [Sterolibacterium sp.]